MIRVRAGGAGPRRAPAAPVQGSRPRFGRGSGRQHAGTSSRSAQFVPFGFGAQSMRHKQHPGTVGERRAPVPEAAAAARASPRSQPPGGACWSVPGHVKELRPGHVAARGVCDCECEEWAFGAATSSHAPSPRSMASSHVGWGKPRPRRAGWRLFPPQHVLHLLTLWRQRIQAPAPGRHVHPALRAGCGFHQPS